MNREQAEKFVPIFQAFAEGKTIQWFDVFCEKWIDLASPNFFGRPSDYRIKPEPMVVYVNVYSDGSGTHLAYDSLESAERAETHTKNITRRAVKFIEAEDQS